MDWLTLYSSILASAAFMSSFSVNLYTLWNTTRNYDFMWIKATDIILPDGAMDTNASLTSTIDVHEGSNTASRAQALARHVADAAGIPSVYPPASECPFSLLEGLLQLLTGRGLRSNPAGHIAALTGVGRGPSHTRLPHFRLEHSPSAGGDELQSEYFVDLPLASGAFRALHATREIFAPYL